MDSFWALMPIRAGCDTGVSLPVSPLSLTLPGKGAGDSLTTSTVDTGPTPSPLTGEGGGEGETPPARFDVVLANITARTNAALAPFHAVSLAAGGRLVASGILEDTQDLVREAFATAGLVTLDVRQDGDWVAIHAAHEP